MNLKKIQYLPKKNSFKLHETYMECNDFKFFFPTAKFQITNNTKFALREAVKAAK